MRPIALILQGSLDYINALKDVGFDTIISERNLMYADIVVFTGGADVHPSMYGEDIHPTTSTDIERDIVESKIFTHCVEKSIPMVGICRGSQFLTVMNGGKLIQNVSNHTRGHDILALVKEKKTAFKCKHMQVTSTHHQMMYPYDLPVESYRVLAHANNLSKVYQGAPVNLNEPFKIGGDRKEPEVVWYRDTNCLCLQYHPEYMPRQSDGFGYFKNLIDQYIMGKLV